jgi:hypothetical protein
MVSSPLWLQLALQNALRYFPPETHAELAPEFLKELEDYGHIYMYRLLPTSYEMRAYSVHSYPAKSIQGTGTSWCECQEGSAIACFALFSQPHASC